MNREIACGILKEDGLIVDTAEDVSIAVEEMKAAVPGQYDLILMDAPIPVMDGFLAKPVGIDKLKSTLAEFLNR